MDEVKEDEIPESIRQSLAAQVERVHEDIRNGEMHLMYRRNENWKPGMLLGGAFGIPIVTRPWCPCTDDCEAKKLPQPTWPENCTCLKPEMTGACSVHRDGEDPACRICYPAYHYSRDWIITCPAHGRDSNWSWAARACEKYDK